MKRENNTKSRLAPSRLFDSTRFWISGDPSRPLGAFGLTAKSDEPASATGTQRYEHATRDTHGYTRHALALTVACCGCCSCCERKAPSIHSLNTMRSPHHLPSLHAIADDTLPTNYGPRATGRRLRAAGDGHLRSCSYELRVCMYPIKHAPPCRVNGALVHGRRLVPHFNTLDTVEKESGTLQGVTRERNTPQRRTFASKPVACVWAFASRPESICGPDRGASRDVSTDCVGRCCNDTCTRPRGKHHRTPHMSYRPTLASRDTVRFLHGRAQEVEEASTPTRTPKTGGRRGLGRPWWG